MLGKLQGKKIAVVGMGTNNRRLAEFLAQQRIQFEVIDGWHDPEELIGKLDNFDVIFRSPGLPLLSKAVQQAQAAGVEISSQTKLFFQLCPCPIIGITGTKGKGTTSSLIVKILDKAGTKAWLGGNIGTDPFEFINQIKPDDFVVLELSSFQLQDLNQSPHIAVVLNITPDHLNHHANFEEYLAAKSNIVSHQTKEDIAILHPNLPDSFKNLGSAQKVLIDPSSVAGFKTKLLGRHNLENIAAAVSVAKVLGVSEDVVLQAVAEFEPLPHRLNIVGKIGGVTYIDDAYSTNIDPTIAAIKALEGKIVLAVGGFDKGLDFTKLGEAILQNDKIKALIVFGAVTEKIVGVVQGFRGQILTGSKNMTEIVDQARSLAAAGDTVLFSPGTSSFDMFQNETDRGEQFVNAVRSLSHLSPDQSPTASEVGSISSERRGEF